MIIEAIKKEYFEGMDDKAITVTFGFDDETFFDLFPEDATHCIGYIKKLPNEKYMLTVDVVETFGRVQTIRSLDCKKPADKVLLDRAMNNDFNIPEDAYEIIL